MANNNKKLISPDLSDEALLAAIEQYGKNIDDTPVITKPNKDKTLDDTTEDPIVVFISHFNFKRGKIPVNAKLVYELFKGWNRIFKINYNTFKQKFGLFYPSKKIAGQQHFLLDVTGTRVFNHISELDIFQKKPKKFIRKTKDIDEIHRFLTVNKLLFENWDDGIYVEVDVLYHVYDTWSYKQEIPSIPYLTFKRVISSVMPSRLVYNYILTVRVNRNISTLITKESVSNWRLGRPKTGGIQRTKDAKEKLEYAKFNQATDNSILYKDDEKK